MKVSMSRLSRLSPVSLPAPICQLDIIITRAHVTRYHVHHCSRDVTQFNVQCHQMSIGHTSNNKNMTKWHFIVIQNSNQCIQLTVMAPLHLIKSSSCSRIVTIQNNQCESLPDNILTNLFSHFILGDPNF